MDALGLPGGKNARHLGHEMQNNWQRNSNLTASECFFAALWKHDRAQGYQLTHPGETPKDVIYSPAALRAAGAKRLLFSFSKTPNCFTKLRMPYSAGDRISKKKSGKRPS